MSPFHELPITTSDKTFIKLRADIVEGVISSGSKLSEVELSKRYEVSRAVIREALTVWSSVIWLNVKPMLEHE